MHNRAVVAAAIYLAAGAGNMAWAVQYSGQHDAIMTILSLAGGFCGCFAGTAIILGRPHTDATPLDTKSTEVE